jgi:hypothetical protein
MPVPFALALAGAMLASATHSGATTAPGSRLAGVESFSLAAGRALGAAASCAAISGGRIDDAAQGLGTAIERMARGRRELAAAQRRLVEGVGEGGSAVELGALDCAEAERALAEIERQLRQSPPEDRLRITDERSANR